MRIAILGNSGSGKSTLAKRLSEHHGIPLLHLDAVNFDSGWRERPPDEKLPIVSRFMENDDWVIEGNYEGLLFQERLEAADEIIVLDLGRVTCVTGVLRRWLRYRGTVRDSMAEGCVETLDLGFLRWVAFGQFSGGRAERMRSVADTYLDKTHIFRTRREIERYLRTIGARGSAYQPPNGCGIHEIRGRRSGVREARDLEGGRHCRRLERGAREVPGAFRRGPAGLVRGGRAVPIRFVIREDNMFVEGASPLVILTAPCA